MATQTHEFKAKTVDDAIDEGLRILALSRNEVEIEIVQKGSRGIFGLGSEPAIVRLTPRTPDAPTVVTPSTPVAPAPVPTTGTPRVEAPAVAAPEDVAVDMPSPAAAAAEVTTEEATVSTPTGVAAVAPAADEDEETPIADTAPDSLAHAIAADNAEDTEQELVEMASDLLRQMVRLMGFEAEIQASWQEEDSDHAEEPDEDEDEAARSHAGRYLLLDVEGSELGALIGRRGETLDNMQYLLRLMVNQKVHKWKNIVIDVEHYKSRRVTQLTQLAERMADQVARTGRSISLEPMPANERRIVHMTLRDHPGVYTESYGDGGRRKVHIFAKS